MRISRSTRYALLAMGYIVRHQDEKIILSQDIAKAYNIPLEYLLKILQLMVRADILQSKRGPRGGFSLARTPKKITMLQVLEAVEGPMAVRLDLAEHAPKEKFSAAAEKAYEKAVAQARNAFDKTKFSDLVKP